MKEKDIELEIVNEENIDLQEKLDAMTQELKDLKRTQVNFDLYVVFD